MTSHRCSAVRLHSQVSCSYRLRGEQRSRSEGFHGTRRHARASGSYAVLLDDGECLNLSADKAAWQLARPAAFV